MEIEEHLIAAIEAANKAGAFLLEQESSSSLEIKEKHDNDYVTSADGASERLIIEHLRKFFPDERFFGEEGGADDRGGSAGRWIIDPIDGTTNFFRGLPNYTVSIAWELEPFKPLVGVVYNPRQKELFHAAQGLGAWCGEHRLAVSSISDPGKALLVCVPPHRRHDSAREYFATMERIFFATSDLRSFGSAALELSYIAAGRLDGYYERFLGYYDIAAGMAILQEAGGTIAPANDSLPFSDMECDVIASNGLLQTWMERTIRNH
jgi:myo-inositol-1(or 4)-monophosphatase